MNREEVDYVVSAYVGSSANPCEPCTTYCRSPPPFLTPSLASFCTAPLVPSHISALWNALQQVPGLHRQAKSECELTL